MEDTLNLTNLDKLDDKASEERDVQFVDDDSDINDPPVYS